jgi:hypothetical protein
MGRTIGAAIGAIILFLFFVLGVEHSRPAAAQPQLTASARR